MRNVSIALIVALASCSDHRALPPAIDDAPSSDVSVPLDDALEVDAPTDSLAVCSAPGMLDPQFGQAGVAPPLFGLAHGLAGAGAVVVDGFSRIVVAGGEPPRDNEPDTWIRSFFTIYRLLPNGSLDTSFAAGGRQKHCSPPAYDCWWEDLVLQPDGKLVAVGGFNEPSGARVALARYNQNGDLDGTFGSGGMIIDEALPQGHAVAVEIDSQGRIVIAAYCVDGFEATDESYFTTVRYLPDGVRDPSFGINGVAESAWRGGQHEVFDLALQSDGRLLVAGLVHQFGAPTVGIGVARYSDNGMLDRSFGSMGLATHSMPGGATGVMLDSAGRAVVTATVSSDTGLARFNTDGSTDSTFGTGGVVVTNQPLRNQYLKPLVLDDGRLLAVGQSGTPGDVRFALARYSAAGVPDATFGVGGISSGVSPPATVHFGMDAAVQLDGKVVVVGMQLSAGGTNADFLVARFCP